MTPRYTRLTLVLAATLTACESQDFGLAPADAVDSEPDRDGSSDDSELPDGGDPDADTTADDADGARDAAPDGPVDAALDGSGDASLPDASDGSGAGDAGDAALDGSGLPDAPDDAASDVPDLGTDATDPSDVMMGGDATSGDTDLVDYACNDLAWSPPLVCGPPVATEYTCEARQHINEPTPIAYDMVAPACGPHRPQWGAWGAYEFMPPQRYLHNLEHGGVAFLYHPCAPSGVVTAMRAFAAGRAASDDGQAFRWVLTPAPDLEVPYVIATWGHRLALDCWDDVAVDDFIVQFYRQAPEDIGSDGSYNRLWLGRTAE